jgi:hypothetical protein
MTARHATRCDLCGRFVEDGDLAAHRRREHQLTLDQFTGGH